jgi:hypothetical protein
VGGCHKFEIDCLKRGDAIAHNLILCACVVCGGAGNGNGSGSALAQSNEVQK